MYIREDTNRLNLKRTQLFLKEGLRKMVKSFHLSGELLRIHLRSVNSLTRVVNERSTSQGIMDIIFSYVYLDSYGSRFRSPCSCISFYTKCIYFPGCEAESIIISALLKILKTQGRRREADLFSA